MPKRSISTFGHMLKQSDEVTGRMMEYMDQERYMNKKLKAGKAI
jgi:hypothetical protein